MTRFSSASEQTGETGIITDFELVRNADGAWLLVVPELPDALSDNPIAISSMQAYMEEETLVIESSVFSLRFQSLVAGHYAKAIAADRPREILLCVVDDDGLKRLSRIIPFRA
jgi:hypothetical protein